MRGDITRHAKDLKRALKRNKPHVMSNRDILHAAAILVIGIRHADREARILSHRLEPALYADPDFLDAVDGFLSKGSDRRLKILVETDIGHEADIDRYPLLNLVRQCGDQIDLAALSQDTVQKYSFNFMTMDDVGYRLAPDRSRYTAIASFNSEQATKRAEKLNQFHYVLRKTEGCRSIP